MNSVKAQGGLMCLTDPAFMAEKSVATDIYWLMPGPRSFIEAIATLIIEYRWVAVRVPAVAIPGMTTAVEAALHRAHLDNEQARWAKITDGIDVAAQIGTIFGVPSMHPSQLADAQGAVRTIVLEPRSDFAVGQCEQYLEAFAEAVSHVGPVHGRACLLLILPQSLESTKAPISRSTQEIVFSGALTQQEMQAYVAFRMTTRSGPGNTGLLRMLVTEFAGIDAQLAEELIALPDEALLGLPKSLEALSTHGDARWRTGRWAHGCYADAGGQRLRHVLYELYLARHSGPEQRDAGDWLKRRYWRACLRSLLPWLEERRSRVIDVLRGALERHLSVSGGKAIRTTASGYRIATDIDDLEYNQIPGMVLNEGFKVSGEPRLRLAVDVCFAAKRVRDSMAHMRPPEARMILEMTELMGRLLQE